MARQPSSNWPYRPSARTVAFGATKQPCRLHRSTNSLHTVEPKESTRLLRRQPLPWGFLIAVLMAGGLPARAEPASRPATRHAPAEVTANGKGKVSSDSETRELTFQDARDLDRMVTSGGTWRVEGGRLIGTCSGDRSWATYRTAYKRMSSVLVRAGIVPPSQHNLRIWAGPVHMILNWELADENHFRTGPLAERTRPSMLVPGKLHDIELKQQGDRIVVSVDGTPVYEAQATLSGRVSVQAALGSTIAVERIRIAGEPDPGVKVSPVTEAIPSDSPLRMPGKPSNRHIRQSGSGDRGPTSCRSDLAVPLDEVDRTYPFLRPQGRFRSTEKPRLVLAMDDGRAIVSPLQMWSDTGLDLTEGRAITISATGQVRGCHGPPDDWAFGPWGPEGTLHQGKRACTLVGKIEVGARALEFYIGKGRTFKVPGPGRLYLGVSDVAHFDNEGAFIVAVTIDGKPVDFRFATGSIAKAPPDHVGSTPKAGVRPTGSQACTETSAGDRDYLVGWYNLSPRNSRTGQVVPGPGTLIPVLKIDGAYYSVCRGVEVPFRPCPAGLEWAITRSSMVGTTIGFDRAMSAYYIIIEDRGLANNCDSYVSGDKQPITKVDKPSGLLDPTAKPPRTNDDFLGFYQPAWMPGIGWEIRKEGRKYLSAEQLPDEQGVWKTRGEAIEVEPLPDSLGFTSLDRRNAHRLTYNEGRRRFELTFGDPHVLRMPLVRVSPASSCQSGAVPPPRVIIGIPSWH